MTNSALHLPHTFRCSNHPDREGVGICVGCRDVVCVECSTKIEGMNYCTRCLSSASFGAGEATGVEERAGAWTGIPLLVLSFAGAALVFFLMGVALAWIRTWAPGGVQGQ